MIRQLTVTVSTPSLSLTGVVGSLTTSGEVTVTNSYIVVDFSLLTLLPLVRSIHTLIKFSHLLEASSARCSTMGDDRRGIL